MKKRTCFWVCAFGLIAGGCTGSFTSQEVKLLKEGKGKMRLWTVDVPEEAAFLRQKARPLKVPDMLAGGFNTLKERMLATVTDTMNPGVGIAAPQVGIGSRVIAVQRFDKEGEPFEFYINPEIIRYSDARICGAEGCLSVPEKMDSVWRSEEIVIEYIGDPELERRREVNGDSLPVSIKIRKEIGSKTDTVKGFTAVIFQHEIDHLNGILFTDRIGEKK